MNRPLIVSDADVVSKSRAVLKPGLYALIPRANRLSSLLTYLHATEVQVLITPQVGARFIEYELLIQPGGGTRRVILEDLEHFLFVLDGELELTLDEKAQRLDTEGYAWIPPAHGFRFVNSGQSICRALWLKREFVPVEEFATPGAIVANVRDVASEPEDTHLSQHLLPFESGEFDMAMNILHFEPGVYFSAPESHVMEHGLYMLQGRGVYWLGGDYLEVQADDFIYMAPFCPQFFYATGWGTSRYLLYKDVNRDFTAEL